MKNSIPNTAMAAAVRDYCSLIDDCNKEDGKSYWLRRMAKLLPRLHLAVVSLEGANLIQTYDLPNDDLRCELFMSLNQRLHQDTLLWSNLDRADARQSMCEQLADDFTDIYFDLKSGLELHDHQNTTLAMDNWYSSFYNHWGQHLVDAESWLHAVETRNYNTCKVAVEIFRTA
ncbi:MAG: DUF5063 domain-containing protein [Gammaproteobacteria bacterium]|nr:DUF5063 domain-containing protein [Gammaproteobacteria bacterium]MDH5799702.1 DUF5063 domain-containing protein [Gammaproteobacteria bacterium]